MIKQLLIVFVLIFTCSCSPQLTKGFIRQGKQQITTDDLYPFFGKSNETLFFNMDINYKSNNFSGLLVVKPMGSSYRAVLNSHFGMGIFDFEISQKTLRVIKCAEPMNNKIIIKTLEKDFRNMLYIQAPEQKAKIYKQKTKPNAEIVKIKKRYYYKNNAEKNLLAMEMPGAISSLRYTFSDHAQGFPNIIEIKHTNIGLDIKLEKLQNQAKMP